MQDAIDIEHLLIWAYRDIQIDRQMLPVRAMKGPGLAASSIMLMGCRIDGGRGGMGDAPDGDIDEAMEVHRAVCALGAWWVEWTAPRNAAIWNAASLAEAGFVVERRGERHVRLPAVQRAPLSRKEAVLMGGVEMVVSRALAQPEEEGAPVEPAGVIPLIVQMARAGARPEWHEGHIDRGAAEGRGGTDLRGRRRAQGEGIPAAMVAFDRALYAVWWWALAALAAEITEEGRLPRPVTGPAAPAAPWEGGRGRVLEVVRAIR